ncbi:MAG: LPXTG cell wall anchor domain-containing protein [Lachnospiraceae bacterium]|nr:LPXTG cell wall anchor domain-containing protein [Lachnospiraceae bacterium]
MKGRGTAAVEGYNWEADYEYAMGKGSKDPYPKRPAAYPNLGEPASVNWDWGNSDSVEMTREPDGTYSYSWIFQTNDPQSSYFMDALEVNGVGITVPFYPHYLWDDKSGETIGSESGMDAWYTETTLPDGAIVRVEYLLVFGNAQRHYRFIITNARSNVSITGMNLNMYIVGAPEFSIYQLEGVIGATAESSDALVEAIQYYYKGDEAKSKKPGWSEDTHRANVVINAIDYKTGDMNNGGANIRFKLAEGYDSPYYLFESARDGVIYGRDHSLQASAMRNEVTGHVDRESQNAVVPYVSDGTKPWMRYDGNTPIPVSRKGEPLYDEDGNPFTEWSKIRIGEDDEGQVLIPRLYATPGPHNPENPTDPPLTKEEVIAGKGEKVFNFGEDINANLKSRYIYEGTGGWYYIRLTGQGRWINDNMYVDPGSGNPYKIALLTIVARPKRYVVRYMPNTLEGFEDPDGNAIVDVRIPGNMPVIAHYASCPKLFRENNPDRHEEQFDDNLGAFYDVDINNIAVLRRTKPTDPKSYYKFVDWVLVDEDYQPVRRHVIGSDGNWLKVNGEYVMEEVHFTSGSIDIKDISEFGILNDDIDSVDMDIYVLLLMPTWNKVERPFRYTVALNWVDASGGLHNNYFHGYWSDVLTYYALDEYGLNVKVLTDAGPFRKWLDRHPTYTFWDAVNNATDGANYNESDSAHEDRESDAYKNLTDDEKSEEEKIRDALDAFFPEIKNEKTSQKKYNAVLKALLNKDKGGSSEIDDFNRNGDYTFTVWENKGVISIWMYESNPDGFRPGSGNGNSSIEPDNSELSSPTSEVDLTTTPTTSGVLSLPQTGQLWWPVTLLATVGVLFLIVGVLLFIRKKESEEFEEPYE